MADISINVDGLAMPNPFVIGSGPPGTNEKMICKAFDAGWGAVICKTLSLEADKVINVAPRYGKLKSRTNNEVIGFENIELISDRPIDVWEKELRACKDKHPEGILIVSIMEECEEWRWKELTERCEAAGADAFELNFSCPHGLPERKMGAAMGQDCEIVEEVTGWVRKATKKPIWAKMTPNITHISEPAIAAMKGGANGISAINTILSVIGVDLDTLRPMPTVEGYTVAGGYSAQAVRPIALRMVMEIARDVPNASLSGIGGVECASDAIQFILLGSNTVQVCTGAMLQGFGMVTEMCDGLSAFMDKHEFASVEDFRGSAVQYFTTHADLVQRQKAAKVARAGQRSRDNEWQGDKITAQTDALTAESGSVKVPAVKPVASATDGK